ncbi:MAG: gliding motility-associated C-terminal domain-containing protein [Bacteroidetes bacterium]|nr:gliding motility-associated C-terminal domain-containing protein [Bacteroidota bacterium]
MILEKKDNRFGVLLYRLILLFTFSIFVPFHGASQLCTGSLGAPVFLEDFGSGSALYGPALPAGVTNYIYQTGNPPNGTYVISNVSNPSGVNLGYVNDYDHSGTTTGYMMVVNSDYPPSEVYRKHVTGLCQNTTYVFSAYLANNNTPSTPTTVCPGYVYANVKFQVEYPLSVVQASVTSGNLPLGYTNTSLHWVQAGFVFTTLPGQTSVDIVLINNAPGGCGNDYVVDDISLSPCGPGIALGILPSQNSYCLGDSLILTSSYTSGAYVSPQYQWEFSNNNGVTWTSLTGAITPNYTINPLTSAQLGLYRLLASENGNISSANCRIIAGPITFSVAGVAVNSATICSAQQATLQATGATNYTWSTGATTSSIVVNPSSTTTYSVSGGSGSCMNQAISTVSVIPSPTLSVSGNSTLCAGQSTTLSATGATSYTWNNGNTSNSIVTSPGITTTYSVIGINGQCTSQSTITVNVLPMPALVLTGTNHICQGQQTILNASGATNYTWSNGASTPSVSLNPNSTSSYTVIGSIGSCTQSVVTTVTVDPIPIITISGNTTICSGNTGTLNATGATTYSWNTGNTGASLLINPGSASVYSVTGITGICSNTASIQVNVSPTPSLGITGSTVICSGQASTLTASGATSYTWNTGVTSSSIQINPASATGYTVIGSVGSCTSQATTHVVLSSVYITGTSTVCAGGHTVLNANGASTYTWSNGSLQPSINVSPITTTIYTLTGTTGTCTTQTTLTVFVNQSPELTISGNKNICAGETLTLSATGAYYYSWNNGSLDSVIVVSPITTSNFMVIGGIGTCTASAIATVSVFPMPLAQYTVNPNPVDLLEPLVFFQNESSNYTKWNWNFGDNSTHDSVHVNPSHIYNSETAGTYKTSLTVENSFGCFSTAYVIVVVEPQFVFYIPNSFTPANMDGVNDTFSGKGIGIEDYMMWIYDRWGTCIYKTDDLSKGWDGRVNGKNPVAQNEVYTWRVLITDVSGKIHEYTGSVTIIQ